MAQSRPTTLFDYNYEEMYRDAKTENNYDKLLQATENNDLGAVESLIKRGAYVKPTFRDVYKHKHCGPLHVAANNGNVKVLKVLLEAKDADINMTGDNNQTLLHGAIKHPEMVRFLIGCGIDVNAQCCHGFTSLHFAVSNKESEVAKILIDSGASPYICSYPLCSSTPLCWAKSNEYKNDELAQYMQENYKRESKNTYKK